LLDNNTTGGDRMNLNKIAIIGAGSGGLAFATYFANAGISVTVYDNDITKINALKEKRCISVTGIINADVDSLTFTDSLEEALSDVRLIMVSITTNNIAKLAINIAPFINPSQIFVLNPGHTFGALEFVYTLKANGVQELPIVAETQDLIFVSKLDKDYNLKIIGIKKQMDIASYNPKDINEVISVLLPYFPQFNPVKNIWITSLNNMSSILHPIPTLLNISRVEGNEDYLYYCDGITQTVAEIMNLADQERLAIGQALDVNLIPILDWMKSAYNTGGNTIYECIQNNKAYSQILGPKTKEHRFIFEDILSGLVPLTSMGHKLNISTRTMDAFIDLGNIISRRDYRKEGRTLDKIGLDQMEIDSIKNLFK